MQAFDDITIEVLNLSRRICHALTRSGVLTIGDLRQFYLNNEKNQIRMIGDKSLDEISKALDEFTNNPALLAHIEKEPIQLSFHKNKWRETTSQASIDDLNLPTAIKCNLKKYGFETVEDLRKAPDSILSKINRVGPKTLTEIRQKLARFVDEPDMHADKEPPVAEERSRTWSQIVEDYFRNEKEVHTYILISRFGHKPKKLEEIATELGITRERVRQIQEAVAIRYINYIRFAGAMSLLGAIERIFSEHGEELSLAAFEAILKREGLLGQFSETITTARRIRDLDLLETLTCWLGLLSNKKYTLHPIEFSVDISDLTQCAKISIRDHAALMNISTKERRKIKRKVLFTGGITIKETAKILSTNERVAVLALKSLNLQKIDSEWFSSRNLVEDKHNSRIPLRMAGLKMLAVDPMMDIETFHDGLRRYASRFYTSIAPVNVIEHFLPKLGFEIKDSKVSTRLSVKGILSQSEKSLITAIAKNEGVASFLEIAEEFFLQKLSVPAVSVTLKRSPIVEKADDGLYRLRGADISWQQIENAKKRQKRFSQDDEVTHGLDGVVRMKLTVNSYAFLTGVVGAYNVKELSGSWSVIHESKSFGEAKIDDVYLWGLSKLFKELDVKRGDRVELGFNTWNRTISLERVNHGAS